jgi:hypothetical protein
MFDLSSSLLARRFFLGASVGALAVGFSALFVERVSA